MPRPSSRETAPSAIGGRTAFLAALALLIYAVFFHLPKVFVSTHELHFAGFYIFSLACAAAAKHTQLLTVGAYVAALAAAVEAVRTATWLPLETTYLDGVADCAGVFAALGPMLLQKVRTGFDDGSAAADGRR